MRGIEGGHKFRQFKKLENALSSFITCHEKLSLSGSEQSKTSCLLSIDSCISSLDEIYGKESALVKDLSEAQSTLKKVLTTSERYSTNSSEELDKSLKHITAIVDGVLYTESLYFEDTPESNFETKLLKLKYDLKNLLHQYENRTEKELESEDYRIDLERKIAQWGFNTRKLLADFKLEAEEKNFLKNTYYIDERASKSNNLRAKLTNRILFFTTFSATLLNSNSIGSSHENGPILITPIQLVEQICARFHLFANNLKKGKNRFQCETINNEAVLQTILEALLCINFDKLEREKGMSLS